jgi:hypothetical protein
MVRVVTGANPTPRNLCKLLVELRESALRAHRAARAFLIFAMMIGVVQFALALVEGAMRGEVPALILTFALAVFGFYLVLCISAMIGDAASRTNDATSSLVVEVICVRCNHRQHVANLRCTKCRAHIGVPESLKRSCLYCMVALAVFQGLWISRIGNYFFGDN